MKLVIDNLFTEEECKNLIETGYNIGYEKPTIKSAEGDIIKESVRNNGRAIYNNQEFADELFKRIKDSLPEEISGHTLKGLNEELKIYRYEKGQRFKIHTDIPYKRNEKERSFLTVMVYLNEEFTGGQTWFMDGTVTPKTGSALVFTQSVMHSGGEVKEGVKYAIRTDVMYERK